MCILIFLDFYNNLASTFGLANQDEQPGNFQLFLSVNNRLIPQNKWFFQKNNNPSQLDVTIFLFSSGVGV